jgi:catechol 2,3-dioxygenase-like lactoylglutathione lyase family enzyme
MTATQFTDGGIFSHVTVGTVDIARATAFYDAVLAPLNMERVKTHKIAIGYAPKHFSGIEAPFWVVRPYDRKAASPGNGAMVAFTAQSRQVVDDVFSAALASGGSDEGAPGVRAHYHENYYGAYVRDPDGNKICVVCHAPQ